MQFLRNAENNSCAHGGEDTNVESWLWNEEAVPQPASSILQGKGLANLHFTLENCLVSWGPENIL